MISTDFYKGRKIFVTGHTGFKGSWLCKILTFLGADVTGYALKSDSELSLYEIAGIKNDVNSIIGDIRDYDSLNESIKKVKPEIVFHLAAQPLVRESYVYPKETFETNVMGTVNLLESIRNTESVRSVINVTTDKVYKNSETGEAFKEDDELDGFDPYSNSKSCSELVTHSYIQSFFDKDSSSPAVSTVRAGNVIGGGDFAKDRIIPDCIRAAIGKKEMGIRNPYSIRPYQYVLEPLFAYMMIAEKQYGDKRLAGAYNVGPDTEDCVTTGELVNLFAQKWGKDFKWTCLSDGGPHEAGLLRLDCTKIKSTFDWKPVWNIEKAVEKTIEWTKCWEDNSDITEIMNSQIEKYIIDLERHD